MSSEGKETGAGRVQSEPQSVQSATGIFGWLRLRLLPRGEDTLLLAAYAILLTALISFAINQRDLPDWQFYTGLIGLAAMFALHMLMVDLEAYFGVQSAVYLHLAINGGLFWLVNYVGFGAGFSFLPFLLFMLASESFVMMRLLIAASYTAVITLGWFGILWLWVRDVGQVLLNVPSVGLGLIFTITVSLMLVRYGRQTARAEALAAQLKAANAALRAAREREKSLAVVAERLRLARDIHDGLGHHLTALNIQLQAAARLLERDPVRAGETIEVCREQARAALDEVRRSVASMRDTTFDDRQISQVVHDLVREFNRSTPPEARLELLGDEMFLPPAIANTLYRTAQEGLTNARKYAAATNVLVRIRFGAGFVRLCVEDDGIGASRQAAASSGFGLAGLRERAEQLGGSFNAGSRTESGYRIEIEVPLKQPAELAAANPSARAEENAE
jgi:signal transduction histidine kinase